MVSLGRGPQVSEETLNPEPCRGDRLPLRREPQRLQMVNLSPLRGFFVFLVPSSWGSRPRLNICRPSGAEHLIHP